MSKNTVSKLPLRFCGADCSGCAKYRKFLAGDESGVVNTENGYRCCWLPKDYPRGRDCEFRMCCEEKGILFCGECAQFDGCVRAREFYAQPGYEKLRESMLAAVAQRRREG